MCGTSIFDTKQRGGVPVLSKRVVDGSAHYPDLIDNEVGVQRARRFDAFENIYHVSW